MTPVETRDYPIAILDTQIISNLSHSQHQDVMEQLLCSLRASGFAVAVTATTLQELGATTKREKWDAHFQKIKAYIDVVIPVTRHELALAEIAGRDCFELIGRHLRPGAAFPDISELFGNVELLEDVTQDRAWKDRLKQVLPTVDPLNEHVAQEGLESFADLVARQEIKDAATLLRELQMHRAFEGDVTEAFAAQVLARGRAIRAVVLMGLANQYDRIERMTRGLNTAPAGSLSDSFILSEAAYFDLVVTMDEAFGRAGRLFNQAVAKPVVRYLSS